MKPWLRIANLFIYTSKQVGQINDRINKMKKLFNEVDYTYSRGINLNLKTRKYELDINDYEKLNALFDEWENMKK